MIQRFKNSSLLLFSYSVIQLFVLIPIYGQSYLSWEQELEIMESDTYFFGEGSALNETAAGQLAITELSKIVSDSLSESVEEKDIILQTVRLQAQTAQVRITGRVKVLAWIDKKQVREISLSKVDQKQPTPNSAHNQSNNESDKLIRNKEESEAGNFNSIAQNPKYLEVVKELADCSTIARFINKADSFKRNGRLIYGLSKASFHDSDKCLIAVFSDGMLIALLGEGNDSRENLLSGDSIQNPEQYYKDHQLLWIQVNVDL
jgi:hypothetical protein